MQAFESGSQSSSLGVEQAFESTQAAESIRTKSASSNVVLLAVLVAIGYYLGSKLGFALTPAPDPIATFWPPNATLLASLLLSPKRMWLPFLIAVLPAHLLVQFGSAVPLPGAIGWYFGNVGEAVIGALLIRRFSKESSPFDSVSGLIVFLIFGVVAAPLLTSFFDAGIVIISGLGHGYWIHWITRQLSNMLAELTLVPTIVIGWLNTREWVRKATPDRYAEAALLAVGIAAVSVFVFGADGTSRLSIPALLYLPLPFLLWASLRFGLGGLSASMLAITVASVWNAMHGRGPFTSASMGQNILALQVFLSTIAIPLMLLASVIQERRLAEDNLRAAASRIVETQEQSSQRIARELHDGLGQQLAIAQMELGEIRDLTKPPLKDRLDKLYDEISDASDAAREISHGLHPARLEHLGLVAALKSLSSEISTAKQIRIQFNAAPLPEAVPYNISLCMYRVSQEALQNIAKHSHAKNISIDLRQRDGRLQLQIADDGSGFVPLRASNGIGMNSMRERVRSVGGTIDITSAPNCGTKILASIPLA